MSDENRIETRIPVQVVFKQENDNLHLESTATFNKQQQNGYKITTIEFVENSADEEGPQNDCAVLQSIVGIHPRIRNIVSLKLSHCKLSNIPKSFCILPLRSLDLSYNLLKTVPLCISIGLPELEELNLSHNEIRCFPTEPKCVKHLKVLNLEDNMFANIPMWILRVKCFKLEKFYYNDNDLSSLQRDRFATTPRYKLTHLYLRNCCLMDSDFKVLKTIRTLVILDIGNVGNKNCNGMSKLDLLFEEAHFANYIENLSVCNIPLCYIPENIINLKCLKRLNVSNNNLSWLPDSIVELRHLQHLNFSSNKVVRLPDNFRKLESLEELVGPFNSLTHVPTFNLPLLRYVDFYSNEISSFESNLDSLQMVDLEQNYIDTTRFSVHYTQSLNAFRTKHNDQSRLFNEKEDAYLNSNTASRTWSSLSSLSSFGDAEDNEYSDSIMNCSSEQALEEEEQWDVVENKFANDIALSDSEWNGEIDAKRVIRCVTTTEYVPDYLFEDAD